MAATTYAPSPTPILDAINSLMTQVECGGRLATGLIVGSDLVEVIGAEVDALRVRRDRREPTQGRSGTLWGLPVLVVEQPGRLAVTVD